MVGTYAVASKYVYVSLKVIGDDNNALGATDYALPMNRNVWKLLQQPNDIEPNYIDKYNPAEQSNEKTAERVPTHRP